MEINLDTIWLIMTKREVIFAELLKNISNLINDPNENLISIGCDAALLSLQRECISMLNSDGDNTSPCGV